MDDHICEVCFRSMFEHNEADGPEAEDGERCTHLPALCCPGCPCESYELAQAAWDKQKSERLKHEEAVHA